MTETTKPGLKGAPDAQPPEAHVLDRLFDVIEGRKGADPASSYTAKLLDRGVPHSAKKMGEEAVETVIAALDPDEKALVSESADLLYHLLVLWAARGVDPHQVWRALEARAGTSGIEEKEARGATDDGNSLS